jgi:hypothetical protein
MCRITVSNETAGPLVEAIAAPAKHAETFFKPVPGEVGK